MRVIKDVRIAVAARSDVGRVRANNEDAYALVDLSTGAPLVSPAPVAIGDRRILLALSDGMGGHEAGEVASALTIAAICRSLQSGAPEPIAPVLDAAMERANGDVATAASEGGKRGMGATLTALVLDDGEAWIAAVGDSRAYLLRGGDLEQITRDQTLVQLLVDRGAMSVEEARTSPQRNVILQAIGSPTFARGAITRVSLRRGDRLLLCCDGLSNEVSEAEIAEILAAAEPAVAADRLIDLANERGGADNLTVIVARLDGEGLALPAERETIAATTHAVRAAGASAG